MSARPVFFITGLPRSRTAWLANFLTWERTFCHHDLFAAEPDFGGFVARFTATEPGEFDVIGHSDPTNALYQDKLIAHFPEARWLIVRRPIAEVHAACQAAGVDHFASLELLQRKIEELRGKVHAQEIDAQEITAASAADAAEWLVPGWRCPAVRAHQLADLNVQTHALAARRKMQDTRPRDPMEPVQLTPANLAYLRAVEALCGEQRDAFVWFRSLLETATVWDHCHDGDGVNPQMAERVFVSLTLDWPRNEWFLRHRAALLPALAAARDAWHWSNQAAAPKSAAYHLYTEVPAVMAWLLGGVQYADRHLPTIRTLAARLLAEDEARDGGAK